MASSTKQAIQDCQTEAVIVAEMLEGIDLMGTEGARFDSARIAVTVAAVERAKQLADALDQIEIDS